MKLFAIVKPDGTIRRKQRSRHQSFQIYDTEGKAKNNARADGDSVIAIDVDLTREPLFIRRKTVTANGS